jgi:hypothetical protein
MIKMDQFLIHLNRWMKLMTFLQNMIGNTNISRKACIVDDDEKILFAGVLGLYVEKNSADPDEEITEVDGNFA